SSPWTCCAAPAAGSTRTSLRARGQWRRPPERRDSARMNFLGHTHVALAGGGDDPGFVLGAVLPDLAPMAGIRLAVRRLDGRLGEGMRCHLRADAAFHAD